MVDPYLEKWNHFWKSGSTLKKQTKSGQFLENWTKIDVLEIFSAKVDPFKIIIVLIV